MQIIISKERRLKLQPQIEPIHISSAMRMYVLGDLLGAFDGEILYDRERAYDELRTRVGDLSKLLAFMRLVVGKCYVLIEKNEEFNVVCSPSSPGLFYTHTDDLLVISNRERDIYSYASLDDLSEMEILNLIISHHAVRSPFTTIFENIERAIPGEALHIQRDLSVRRELYIKKDHHEIAAIPDRDDQENYRLFVDNLEATAQIIEDNWNETGKYLMISGGIDSAVLLIAFLKADADIKPIHWPVVETDQSMAEAICRLAGVDLDVYSYGLSDDGDNVERIKSLYEFGLGMGAPWNSFIINQQEYFSTKRKRPPWAITGQNMDGLYPVDANAPNPLASNPRYVVDILRSSIHRLRYTDNFYRYLCEDSLHWLDIVPIETSEQFNRKSAYDYLLSLSIPTTEHITPLVNKQILPESLSELSEIYTRFKRDQVLTPLLTSQEEKISYGIENWSAAYMNHIVRLLKSWCRYVQAAHLNYANCGEYAGYALITPVSEGPLSNFLLTLQLNFKDTISPKRFCYRYFQESFGRSYRSVADDVMRREHRSERLTLSGGIYNKIRALAGAQSAVSSRDPKLEQEINRLFEVFKKLVNSQDSIVLSAVQNDVIRRYLIALYGKIYTDPRQLDKHEIMEIERLVNLEIFLKGLFEDR